MARIAIAGFLHETNTFAPVKATKHDFERAEGWPGLTLGDEILEVFPPANLPIGGFIREARAQGHALVPLSWCAAVPSGPVTEEAYDNFTGMIAGGIRACVINEAIDAVYLDLHGAMVAEHVADGEGALLARVRATIGPDMPLVASLDLHANVTAEMVANADALIAFRTYPHVDMAETGRRAARHLDQLLKGRTRQAKAFRKLDFLPPLVGQCTLIEPAKSLYRLVENLEGGRVSSVSFATGFHPADIAECGPAVLVYGDDQKVADETADALAEAILAREADFAAPMLGAAEAVRQAMASGSPGPVVLADVQDNCGAGATSDTTGLLRALVEAGAEGAVLGLLTDADAARAAHEAGVGGEIEIALGAKAFTAGDPPYRGRFTVEGLSDGRFLCTGPFYGGTRADLGPTAVLATGGVRVVVSAGRMQAADQQIFRHLDIDPEAARILALKSSVHFRADFEPMASRVLIVEAPAAFIDNPARQTYRRLRPGVRLS